MSYTRPLRRTEHGLWLLGRELPFAPRLDDRPDHELCSPAWIKRALQHAQALPSGGWYAVDQSRAITEVARAYVVRGRSLVVWRDRYGILAAPEACPHLGASLAGVCAKDGKLTCPWHGLQLGRDSAAPGSRTLRGYDDGVLFWVQLPDERQLSERPAIAPRPVDALHAVLRMEASCDPRDVIQNRLDPWHGRHFHPHSFASLHVIDQDQRSITVRVAFKVLGPLAVEVDARFHCPDPRSIVMTIVRGEGEGSVVETHATPMRPGRTAIVEATLATSERPGFRHARALSWALRPMIGWSARRLWTEDAAYAERLYALRAQREDTHPEAHAAELVRLHASRTPRRA
jgi:isorenieratene synthase